VKWEISMILVQRNKVTLALVILLVKIIFVSKQKKYYIISNIKMIIKS